MWPWLLLLLLVVVLLRWLQLLLSRAAHPAASAGSSAVVAARRRDGYSQAMALQKAHEIRTARPATCGRRPVEEERKTGKRRLRMGRSGRCINKTATQDGDG